MGGQGRAALVAGRYRLAADNRHFKRNARNVESLVLRRRSFFRPKRRGALSCPAGAGRDSPETAVTYDLLIKGGHVIDPGQGLDGVADVAFKDGKVAAVAERLSDNEAIEVRSAEGLYVAPGVIDLHAHRYWGGTYFRVDADALGRASGIATAVGGRSPGGGHRPRRNEP